MAKKLWWLSLVLFSATAGCTILTHQQFAKIHEGMSQREVLESVGEPLAVRRVIFKGHENDYLVWEYKFVPDKPE